MISHAPQGHGELAGLQETPAGTAQSRSTHAEHEEWENLFDLGAWYRAQFSRPVFETGWLCTRIILSVDPCLP